MIGAYTATDPFAYPGWRLTVPGGPAGGHYKGFTHTQAAGTDIPPNDCYEQDREDGMSSHDPVHASLRNPRGVYRSSAEVPPRPNASGRAMTYGGYQTERHPGTSISPGSFPAPFTETDEDAFLAQLSDEQLAGLGILPAVEDRSSWDSSWEPTSTAIRYPFDRPNTAYCNPSDPPPSSNYFWDVNSCKWTPKTGATSTVAQPAASLSPQPPAPAVAVYTEPPISPQPAPTVATNEVVPDGCGNFINVSTGATVPASAVQQNPATGKLTSPALSWLEEHSIWSLLPNWGVLAVALLGSSLLMGKNR